MKLRPSLLFLILFIALNSFSQEKSSFYGTIINGNHRISNVHIINLTNGNGTLSNENGEFEINAKVNDTILFSSIQLARKKIRVTERFLSSSENIIELKSHINLLEEVTITKLTGDLYVDLKSIPEDTTPKHNFVYNLSDLNKILPDDKHGSKSAPIVSQFSTGGFGISLFNGKSAMNRILKRKLAKKKQFPIKLRKELGDYYFITYLNIPKDKIYNFISYCEYRNISQKLERNKLLEIIEILKEESISYNAIENE